jgi:hypothetical protein
MSISVTREGNKDVVIRSGDFAARCKYQYGGALLEFWKDNFPILTDPWPGSGVVNVIDGQTQDISYTSPDGLTPYSLKDNVYLKDEIKDGSYYVKGYAPAFWLSHEAVDDVQPGGPQCWATPYSLPIKWSGGASVAFVPYGNIVNKSMFFPRNTLGMNGTFTNDMCKYRYGLSSARIKVYLRASDSESYGGIVYRLNPHLNYKANPDHAEVCNLRHHSFIVKRNGEWYVRRKQLGVEITLKKGNISYLQRRRLRNDSGLEIEIRCFPETPSKVEFLIEGKVVWTTAIPNNPLDVCTGLVAYAKSGKVDFDSRTLLDMSIAMVSSIQPVEDNCIDTTTRFTSTLDLLDEPFTLYRAGIGAFLNPFTFPMANRYTGYYKDGEWHEYDGLIHLRDVEELFCGSRGGEFGLKVKPIYATYDGVDMIQNGSAHALISKLQINNSFVLMLNTQPIGGVEQMYSEVALGLRWSSTRSNA